MTHSAIIQDGPYRVQGVGVSEGWQVAENPRLVAR
jgi:hypothetical protein